jgi:hypothetical protein
MPSTHKVRSAVVVLLALALMALGPGAVADQQLDRGLDERDQTVDQSADITGSDPAADIKTKQMAVSPARIHAFPAGSALAAATVSDGIELVGRGERLLPQGTTDVWALNGYAYIGTFNDPCGTGAGYRVDMGPVALRDDLQGPGVPVFDVGDKSNPTYIGNLPSVPGSRINDVKVATQSGRDILVHSNEACAGGFGGFEIYDMTDPRNPVHLASAIVNDANQWLREVLGVVDVGVHNLFLFSQGDRHYAAMQTHAYFGSFQIYELTDPTDPQPVSAWGAEYLCEEDFCSDDPHAETDPQTIVDHINLYMFGGYGTSQNRFLHDITVTEDAQHVYLAHWDAGLVLLDISDPADPELVSVALDPTSGDGEVNSHAVWPSADGTTVVETNEDFDAIPERVPLSNWTVGEWPWNTRPALGISTQAGDDFEANQTGNMVRLEIALAGHLTAPQITVTSGPLAGNVYAATEATGNQPKLTQGAPIEAEAVFVGQGCDTDRFADPAIDVPGVVDPHLNDPNGKIAVVRRGGCSFTSKLGAAQAAGALAVVVADNIRGTSQWGGVRIWDYSDPTNPVLASEFDTVCSLTPTDASCDLRGTYSVHNVVVEGHLAYFSWYSDGVLILDIRDPANPVEVARYNGLGEEFEMQNAGIQDVWGIWKQAGDPWIYASDRNGGLYVLRTTFSFAEDQLDALVAEGGITEGLEAKIRHALEMAEAWMDLPRKRGPALSHLDRAVHLLLWQAGVIEDKDKPNQGDPEGLRALAELIRQLADSYRV